MPPKTPDEWNTRYEDETTPWDSGLVSPELVRALDDWELATGRALELGCGSGTNSVFMAERGLRVTGVDVAPVAIEQAREKAATAGVDVDWLLDDVCHWRSGGEPFDLVFDRGCFHCVRSIDLYGYLTTLRTATRPGTRLLFLTGNLDRPEQGGPPAVDVETIGRELGPLCEIEEVRRFHFTDAGGVQGPLGWSIRARRR